MRKRFWLRRETAGEWCACALRPRRLALAAALLGFALPALATDTTRAPPTPIPVQGYRLVVDGRALAVRPDTVPARVDDNLLLPLMPIARALGHSVRVASDWSTVTVIRRPDRAEIELSLADGRVRVNGVEVGYAPHVVARATPALWLTPSAVETLTGSHVEVDVDAGRIEVRLDARLQEVRGFELVVDGEPLPFPDPEPRSLGSVLLLPLEPIAERLGAEVERVRGGEAVRVVRARDHVEVEVDLRTGVTLLEGRPVGIVPNMVLADPLRLLLPKEGVEALTGTHARILPGSRQVVIETDDRLSSILQPHGSVLDRARQDGFTPELLRFRLGNDIPNELFARAHVRELAVSLDYETPDLLWPGQLHPRWLQLGIDSAAGWSATLGDTLARPYELDGLGVSRLQGATLRLPGDDADFVFLAGRPAIGSRSAGGDRTVPAHDGLAASLRVLPREHAFEYGLAAGLDDGRRAAVGSARRTLRNPDGWLGATTHRQELLAGWFGGDLPTAGPDFRALWESRVQMSERLSLSGRASYDGANFNRTIYGDGGDFASADRLDLDGRVWWRPWSWLATHASYGFARDAVWRGADQREAQRHHGLVGATARPFERGPTLRVDYDALWGRSAAFGREHSRRLEVQLDQEWLGVRFLARHFELWGDVATRVTTLNVLYPFTRLLRSGAYARIAPTLTAARSRGAQWLDAGVSVSAGSGQLLGSRFRVQLDYSLAAPVVRSGLLDARSRHFLNVAGILRVLPRVELELAYRTAFDGDDQVLVQLRGELSASPPRHYRKPLPGTGLLTGSVFLDHDGDGVQGDGEDGLGNVPVRLEGTTLGLRTNASGGFTIQNLRAGVYDLVVVEAELPLDVQIAAAAPRRFRVHEGEVTEVLIPAVRRGQVTGRVFADADGDGVLGPADAGLENVQLVVTPGDYRLVTSAFGQFALEGVEPGSYRIEVDPRSLPPGLVAGPAALVELREDALRAVVTVPVRVAP